MLQYYNINLQPAYELLKNVYESISKMRGEYNIFMDNA